MKMWSRGDNGRTRQGVVEIRTYELTAGSQDAFGRLFAEQVLPMLRERGHDVVHAGPSAHAADMFILVRAYTSEQDRRASQDAFYGSDAWRNGPRSEVLWLIRGFTSGVLPITAGTLLQWRSELQTAAFGPGGWA